jgi:3-oxoacyl-(acyl-carrier-protein) synthase/acyl carrier protein
VAAQVHEILGSAVDEMAPLAQAGLDSLAALELRSALEIRLSVSLPATLLFDYPTIHEISGYLESELDMGGGVSQMPALLRPVMQLGADSQLVIFGSSSKLPRQIRGSVVQDGVAIDCITTVPLSRWDVEEAGISASGSTSTRWAAFISMSTLEVFDCNMYSMPKNEAVMLDPQQRILLELGTELLAQSTATATRENTSETQQAGIGIYVGIYPPEYTHVVQQAKLPVSAYSATGSTSSAAAGRLSFTLGANGPCVSIDTACSSSLIGVHFAGVQLRNRECAAALGLGCNVILNPNVLQILSAANMLSPRGRCAAIDSSADG